MDSKSSPPLNLVGLFGIPFPVRHGTRGYWPSAYGPLRWFGQYARCWSREPPALRKPMICRSAPRMARLTQRPQIGPNKSQIGSLSNWVDVIDFGSLIATMHASRIRREEFQAQRAPFRVVVLGDPALCRRWRLPWVAEHGRLHYSDSTIRASVSRRLINPFAGHNRFMLLMLAAIPA